MAFVLLQQAHQERVLARCAVLESYKGDGKRMQHLWETMLELLRAQGVQLDLPYLRLWGTALDVAALLEQARLRAGLTQS